MQGKNLHGFYFAPQDSSCGWVLRHKPAFSIYRMRRYRTLRQDAAVNIILLSFWYVLYSEWHKGSRRGALAPFDLHAVVGILHNSCIEKGTSTSGWSPVCPRHNNVGAVNYIYRLFILRVPELIFNSFVNYDPEK